MLGIRAVGSVLVGDGCSIWILFLELVIVPKCFVESSHSLNKVSALPSPRYDSCSNRYFCNDL